MATFREIISMAQDQLKNISDDSVFTDDHILFLINKLRLFVLKKEADTNIEAVSDSNYQTICLDLEEVPAIAGEPCEGGVYLKSKKKIPYLASISSPSVYVEDYYQGAVTYVSRDRFKYVGHNKWLKNIIYASLGPDNYLYLKSSNPQYLYLTNIRLTGIFEDADKAAELSLSCDSTEEGGACDPLDSNYPLEDRLVPSVLEMVVKTFTGALYKPADYKNDSSDDLSDIMSFIRRNMKSNLQKQIEDD